MGVALMPGHRHRYDKFETDWCRECDASPLDTVKHNGHPVDRACAKHPDRVVGSAMFRECACGKSQVQRVTYERIDGHLSESATWEDA